MTGAAAVDPVSRLILQEAGELAGTVLVVDDVEGVLSRAALDAGVRVVAACDDSRDEAVLPRGVTVLTGLADPAAAAAAVLALVDVVLWRLPRALSAVSEVAELLAARCPDHVRVVAGGRDKHLTPTMNPVLARSFAEVRGSLGRWKSRVVHATGPIPRELTWPRTTRLPALDLDVVSSGAAFAAGRLDAGTALLADVLPTGSGDAVDLGCGTGILTTLLARGGWRVAATDVSLAATRSTLATATTNGVADRVTVHRCAGLPPLVGPVDLVMSNPPFHRGGAKDSAAAFAFIAAAGAALRRGGELWLVYNAHLPYLPYAREQVGPTQVVERDRSYVVTRSTRRAR